MLVIGAVGAIMTVLLFGLGWMHDVNQYWLLLFGVATNVLVWILSLTQFPKKSYFTVAQMEKELTVVQRKQQKKLNRMRNKKTKNRKKKDS